MKYVTENSQDHHDAKWPLQRVRVAFSRDYIWWSYEFLGMNKHTFKRAVRQTVWQKTGGVCWYCGKQCQPFDGSFSVDHFIPKNKGGTHSIENLMPSCHSCNSVKGDRTIEEFRKLCSGIRFFSSTQKSVLQMLGYTDLDERIKKHTSTFKFWFEKQ